MIERSELKERLAEVIERKGDGIRSRFNPETGTLDLVLDDLANAIVDDVLVIITAEARPSKPPTKRKKVNITGQLKDSFLKGWLGCEVYHNVKGATPTEVLLEEFERYLNIRREQERMRQQ